MRHTDVHEDASVWGSELRGRRIRRGMSLSDLAAAVHFNRGYLSRVERGVRRPNFQLVRLCDSAVDAGGSLIRLAATLRMDDKAPAPADAVEDDAPGPDDLFERIAASSAVLVETGPVGDAALAGAREIFDALRRMGHGSPARTVLPLLAAQFGVLRTLAKSGSSGARRDALLLAAHFAEYAGWMVQENDDERGALAYTAVTARLAREAGSVPLAAYTVLRQADIALYQGDGERVAALAEQVEQDRAAGAEVRLVAAQRAAQGWALAGRPNECRAALDRATRRNETASATEDGHIVLGPSGGGRRMDVVRGWCYLDLGRPEEATEALTQGLAAAPHNARRAKALFGARLALARAASGDVLGACDDGERSLAENRNIESTVGRNQLRLLGNALRRWPGNGEVQHVVARIEREVSRRRPDGGTAR